MLYDRTTENVGNIIEFGHVNTRVPDQRLATLFYVTGLGLTRDPYLVTGVDNMWINAGTTQFHLPTGAPQVLRGTTVLALPDLAQLVWRLERVAPLLQDTLFRFEETTGGIEAISPWGNRIRCVTDPITRLGIIAVELDTALGTAPGIARFYDTIMASPASHQGGIAQIAAGLSTTLVFRETDRELPLFDGSHVQIGLADFASPHARLLSRKLITEESNQSQYRFQDIVDPDTGALLCTIEHEVRSMRHPTYARPLINRDPTVTNNRYAFGREAFVLGGDIGGIS